MPKSEPQKQPKLRKSKGTWRSDKRVNCQPPLTEKRFEQILTKVFTTPLPQFVEPKVSVQVKKRTSVARHADGYIGKRKSRDKIVGKEDLPND